MSDPGKEEKRTPDSSSSPSEQPQLHSGQTFQVREGDRIVIDKRKFRPTFTTYKRRTIIAINEK